MKSKKKVLVTLLCAALLVFASVMGTLAYLQSQTATATNTFTVGAITATLDEAKVDLYGKAMKGEAFVDDVKDADRRTTNTYKLIPGHTYVKDPTIHIAKGSEECYVFVKVVDQITAIQDTDTVAAVTGGLAGIMYGFDGIPKEWIETLRGKDIIENCLF